MDSRRVRQKDHMSKTFATLTRAAHKGRNTKVPRSVRRLFPDVVKMVDATEGVEVTVTPRDCGRGAKPLDAAGCAMARAFERQHEADGAVIGLSRSYIVKGDTVVRFTTPQTVAREIVSFDRSHDFAPGNYHLGPLSPANRGAHLRGPRDPRRRRVAPVVHRHSTQRVRVLGK